MQDWVMAYFELLSMCADKWVVKTIISMQAGMRSDIDNHGLLLQYHLPVTSRLSRHS